MKLKVFKFGGASVKDAAAVMNVSRILRHYPDQPIIIVVSAMGKTTNALEKLARECYNHDLARDNTLIDILNFHESIIRELFPNNLHPVYEAFTDRALSIKKLLNETPGANFDFEYARIVCYGELFSSMILSHYLNDSGLAATWFDVRDMLITDANYREANVNWDKTIRLVSEGLNVFYNSSLYTPLTITQGFIGSTLEGETTTLGREGSDYTAAIFAYIVGAEEVIIWKDVPGLFNADPKYFKNTVLIDSISYKESLELSYYGAGVIHPHTIKPLQNKKIPLLVKSFNDPEAKGTFIGDDNLVGEVNIPCYIFKPNQWLFSISSRDFSYIDEPALHEIFGIFSRMGIKINLMQNSAISFSVCIDEPGDKKAVLIQNLNEHFVVRYNEGLKLITIRNYTQEVVEELIEGKEIMLEQRSRYTCQLIVKY
jgi:aspartate kinase